MPKINKFEKSFMSPQSESQAIDFLFNLSPAEDMRATLPQDIEVNSHIHLPPNFSAFETTEQALNLCVKENVRILGVGNYYDFTVYNDVSRIAQVNSIFPLFCTEVIALEEDLRDKGIRVNDGGNPGRYYICGKGITKFQNFSTRAEELLNLIRNNDTNRMHKMTESMARLFSRFGVETNLDDNAIINLIVTRHGCQSSTVTIQERHVAMAFQQKLFERIPLSDRKAKLREIFGCEPDSQPDDSVGVQNEIRSRLMKAGKPCYEPETFVTLSQAKELIHELGGISCYPVLADGADPLCEYEHPVDKLIETLKENNFSMVEFITVRNQPDVLLKYATALRKAGIVVTAGTEHNTLDLIPLKPACAQQKPVPEKLKNLFLEGACVIAAHQYLCANGKCGFVDDHGKANPSYDDSEQRIKDFERMGSSLITEYFKTKPAKE
jgi:hypothetical protein